jgi:hypothetical protein
VGKAGTDLAPKRDNSLHWVKWWGKLPIEIWVVVISPSPNDDVVTDYRAGSDMYADAKFHMGDEISDAYT